MTSVSQVIGIGYIKTMPGIIRICQEIVNFVGMLCVAASANSARGKAFVACSTIALIVTAIFILSYVTQLISKIQIPWYRIEFFFSVIWILFYIIVASLVIATRSAPFIAGGIFGLAAAVLYGVDAFLTFKLVAIV